MSRWLWFAAGVICGEVAAVALMIWLDAVKETEHRALVAAAVP